MTRVAPEEIDGFRLGEVLHQGSFGAIHRVRSADGAAPLVMKLPHLGPDAPASVLACHEAERMALAALRGPHVPHVVAVGDLSRVPYLVMEEVAGRGLEDLTEQGPHPPDEVARLGAAIAAALAAVHAQGVIHLDVKPENVIIRPGGAVVLVDFGLSRRTDLPDLVAEEVAEPVGTPAYVSPEQLLGVRDDPRSDLFALGVILYELATGRLPFGSPRTATGLRRRLHRDPTPPRALVPGTPPWLQEVVLWCLEPDPSARPPSAAAVRRALSEPEGVPLGARAARLRRDPAGTVLVRWIRAGRFQAGRPGAPAVVAGQRSVVAAVATAHASEARHQALREAVGRIVAADPPAHLTCVSVIDPPPVAARGDVRTPVLRHLVLLHRWAEPLGLPAPRVRFHVLESSRPQEALLDYLRANNVHHVVVGAKPDVEPLRRLFRTMAATLADEAPCDVTVVRYRI